MHFAAAMAAEIRHEGKSCSLALNALDISSTSHRRSRARPGAKRPATIEPQIMRPLQQLVLSSVVVCSLAVSVSAATQNDAPTGKFYQVVNGQVDERTYNGFRRYHAGCNHCHGPDGVGSTFGPSLVEGLSDVGAFRRIVRDGRKSGTSVMKGFADDPNVAPYIDDIYAYLQARTDGALGRGRPTRLEQ
jgi:mono/diheme cytochrome c family protein